MFRTDQTTRQDWICYDFYFTAIRWARKFKKLSPLARTRSLSPWLQWNFGVFFEAILLVWKIIPAFLTMVFVVINFRLAMRTAAFSAAAALDPLSYSLPPGMLGIKSKKIKRLSLRFFWRLHYYELKQLGASLTGKEFKFWAHLLDPLPWSSNSGESHFIGNMFFSISFNIWKLHQHLLLYMIGSQLVSKWALLGLILSRTK